MADRSSRAYKTSDLPALRADAPSPPNQVLLGLYEQTCTTWRMLVDVRFKLFALVPTASLLSLATIIGGAESKNFDPWLRLIFAILGLMATVGLLIYELRNSDLHDDLISRGRRIEHELGVDTGVFLGRKAAKGFIQHDRATSLIYGAAILAWVVAIGVSLYMALSAF